MLNDPDALADLDDAELPQLLVFDDEWQLQARWGPRPPAADALLDEWLALHPEFETLGDGATTEAQRSLAELNQALTHEMRIWYNSGLDRECVQGVQALLAALQEDGEEEGGGEGDGGQEEEERVPHRLPRRRAARARKKPTSGATKLSLIHISEPTRPY